MIVLISIFFVAYAVSLGGIVSVGYVLQRNKEQKYVSQEEKVSVPDIVVLIPFRNEEFRILGLLNSINNLNTQPKEFIFIDDHSSDNSVEVIESKLSLSNYRIISLPDDITGKKKALRYATEKTNSEYILTLDADVLLEPDYMDSVAMLGSADMYVLPAVLKAEKWYEHFYEIDLVLVTATNSGLAGIARPIMASGANLLYKRKTFDKVDNLESHVHAASGDDTYLLRDFRENKTDVRLSTDPNCAITTETPQSFREFIDQRLRWLGKTGDIKDSLSTSLAILQTILTLLFFTFLVYAIAISNWKMLGALLCVKTVLDLLIFLPYFNRIKRMTSWLFIPVYEIIFPLYTILILVLLFTYKPKWKGRNIYESKVG